MPKLRLLRLQQRGASRLTPQILFLPGSATCTSRGVRARNDLTPPSLPVPWCPGPSAVLSKGAAPRPSPTGYPGPRGSCAPTGLPRRACGASARPTPLGQPPSWRPPPCWGGVAPARGSRQGRASVGKAAAGRSGVLVHPWGVRCAWAGATAQGHDRPLSPLLAQVDPPMSVRTATGCQAKPGEPPTGTSVSAGPGTDADG
jgi:hypothetical protein